MLKLFNKNKKTERKDIQKSATGDIQKEAVVSKEKSTKEHKGSQAYRYLISPLITERSSLLREQNKYVFKVRDKSNKIEIKKAVQDMFGVKVSDVNIINIPRKKRKFGRHEGYKAGCKKAVVTLQKGEKIEEI